MAGLLDLMPKLRHLDVSNAIGVYGLDLSTVFSQMRTENYKGLVTVQAWRTHTTERGGWLGHNYPENDDIFLIVFTFFSQMENLEEIDLGWCFHSSSPEKNSQAVQDFFSTRKGLKKVAFALCRRLSYSSLEPMTRNCPDLEQADFTGMSNVDEELIEVSESKFTL